MKSRFHLGAASIGLLACLGLAAHGSAALRVPADYGSIEDAMLAATSGDTVLVAPGIYHERNIALKSGVTLAGETGDPANVIIDGQYLGRLLHAYQQTDVVVRGLTLRNGFSGYEKGGGFNFVSTDLEMESCVVEYCTAYDHGGGGYMLFCSGELREVSFIGNATQLGSYHGGGAYIEGSDILFEDGVFEGNSSEEYGGGLYSYNYSPSRLVNVRFSGNSAHRGGGMRCSVSSAQLEDVLFLDNYTTGTGEGGGLFCGPGCEPVLDGCVFVGNTAALGAGMICRDNGNAQVVDCVFFDNHADTYGGGVGAFTATPSLEGVTLAYNSAGSAGGNAYFASTSSWVTRTIIAFAASGGGVHSNNSYPLLTCSDVFGNTGGDYSGSVPNQTGLVGNISEDPMFCDGAGGNFQLDELSPCSPANNSCGALMGARGVGCGVTATEATTWGALKALYR